MKTNLIKQNKSGGNRIEKTGHFLRSRNSSGGFLLPAEQVGLYPNNAGTKLPEKLRRKMELSFETDLSEIKIRKNSGDAVKLNARAFAFGNTISFAPGQFNPDYINGQELIAHELVHTLQHKKNGRENYNSSRQPIIFNSAHYEREAWNLGKMAVSGNRVASKISILNSSLPVIQREEATKEEPGWKDYVSGGLNLLSGSSNIYAAVPELQNAVIVYKKLANDAVQAAEIAKESKQQVKMASQTAQHLNSVAKTYAKVAQNSITEALIAQKNANIKQQIANDAVRAAGSGKSKFKSLKASNAAKEANRAKYMAGVKDRIAKQAIQKANNFANEAAKAQKNLRTKQLFAHKAGRFSRIKSIRAFKVVSQFKTIEKLSNSGIFKTLGKFKSINKYLGPVGIGATFTSKMLTSYNTTYAGKVVDALGTTAIDAAFGKSNPLVAAIDAGLGLIPGGDRVNIGGTMSSSVSSITGAAESIITGDITGLQKFYEDSLAGKTPWIYEKAFEAGDYWSEHGGAERAKMVGDFYGGPDTRTGRFFGFLGAMPGIGHAGEGLGWLAFKGYEKGGEAIKYAGEKLTEFDEKIMPEGRTLNPMVGLKSIFSGENPFW